MIKTLYDQRTDINVWLMGETVSSTLIDAAINDAIESLWQSVMRASLSNFVSGPISVTLAADDESALLNSLTDPTVAPTITETTSGALAAHTIYACYTIATDSGSETLPSPTTTQLIAINKIATMTSPSYVAGALGYNCYMGTLAENRMAKVNTDPIAFGTAQSEPTTGAVLTPNAPGVPTVNSTSDDLFYIKHLESQTPQGAWIAWNAGDLDGVMMRRASSSIATDSPYQTYAWDLLDGRKLEIRPKVAGAVVPRYFYIKRPRRLAFDGSVMPFNQLPVSEFIRTFALKNIFTALREWQTVDKYNAQAEMARATLVKSVTAQNTPRDQRVAPYLYA